MAEQWRCGWPLVRRGDFMRTRPVRALMIGTAPDGKGGVASVVTVLRQAGFFEQQGIRYVSSHTEHSSSRKLVAMLGATRQLLAACWRGQRPIVHVHSASRASFYRKSLLLALARLGACPTIFHLHGAEFQQFAVKESSPAMRWWIRRTLERSSVVVALSDTWAAFLRGYAPTANIQVVPNSVALPVLPPGECEQGGRVLFLGRADQRKGVFDLLQAVAILAAELPELHLHIGGDGDLAAVTQRAAELGISDRVHLLGWIGADAKAEQLAQAAVFTLPSYDEGLPMSMLEAMAARKALVVTPVGGIPEAVRDGVNGLLVLPGDSVALAAALRRLLSDSALRASLGQSARNTIEQRFSTTVALQRLTVIYDSLRQR